MSIPTGVPLVSRIVKNGSGGPAKNAIPVREDLGGSNIGYLPNGYVVQIVDPNWLNVGKYRHDYNNSVWVDFVGSYLDLNGSSKQVKVGGTDALTELNGHLYPVDDDPTPPPDPGVLEGTYLVTIKKVS